jgi:RNA-binding protein
MLNPAERKALKARAHKLEAVVMIGGKGLTDEVIAEIDRALAAHELIKVRAAGLEREAREQAFSAICQKTAAEPVQQVGKIFVIFRKNP